MSCGRQCSVAERVYRAMLRGYGRRFREHYGQQMMETFRQGQKESCQSGGLKGLVRFWLFILRDWVGSSLFRFYCFGASAAVIFLCWIFLGGRTSAPLPQPNQAVQVARATAQPEETTLESVVHKPIGLRSTHLVNSHAAARRQRSVFQARVFSLEGPATLLDGASSTDSIAREFRLIGNSSINRME